MSRTTLRIVILLAAVSIAGVAITQVYWVRRAFDLRENQFNRDANTALRNVAETIFTINKTPSPFNNPVEQLSTNYFVVNVNGPIDGKLLKFLLVTELEKRNITTDFDYCIYDCVNKCIVNDNNTTFRSVAKKPKASDGYYFAVQFPKLQANLISQMGIWGFSSGVLLIVIAFFVYTLFVILKQRRLSEIQKDFINNMTHEFKTPLSTIAISSGVLKDPEIVNTPARLLNYATIIESENDRLRQHVERVLQVASLDKSDIGIKLVPQDIHGILEEVVRNFSLTLNERRGMVDLELKADKSTVAADKLHLMNVFFNLLDNALKYTARDPRIKISTHVEQKNLSIEIEDNGLGILPEYQKKIFDRFYRIPTGNVHDIKGFGLGLNYVKLVVQAHKGRVSLTSIKDKGSIFSIQLPLL